MEPFYRLVWLVYFKLKFSFLKTSFQSEKNILWNLWTTLSVFQLQNGEWKPQRRLQHYINWIFKSQVGKAERIKWRCWQGCFTSLKEAASLCSQMESTSVTFSNVKILQHCEFPFQRTKNKDEQRRGKKYPWTDGKRKTRLEKECRELLTILNPSRGRKNHWNGCEAILMSCMLTALMQRQQKLLALMQKEFLEFLFHELGIQNSNSLL